MTALLFGEHVCKKRVRRFASGLCRDLWLFAFAEDAGREAEEVCQNHEAFV